MYRSLLALTLAIALSAPLSADDGDRIVELIAGLGEAARTALEQAANGDDPEVCWRAWMLLDELDRRTLPDTPNETVIGIEVTRIQIDQWGQRGIAPWGPVITDGWVDPENPGTPSIPIRKFPQELDSVPAPVMGPPAPVGPR